MLHLNNQLDMKMMCQGEITNQVLLVPRHPVVIPKAFALKSLMSVLTLWVDCALPVDANTF
jgi:hypothetical protein